MVIRERSDLIVQQCVKDGIVKISEIQKQIFNKIGETMPYNLIMVCARNVGVNEKILME